jgi:electron transport complex protein RnfG
MKDTLKLVITLTVICLVAGVLLAWVNGITDEPIRKAWRAEKVDAIKKVLPECDNEPDADAVVVSDGGAEWTFYVARRNGAFVGAAFESTSNEGYGGEISIMVGVNAEGAVQGVEILKAKETPGLGAKIAEPEFRSQFVGKTLAGTTWAVRKDRGDIDEITAATISSRAVVSALKRGCEVYTAHKAAIEAQE